MKKTFLLAFLILAILFDLTACSKTSSSAIIVPLQSRKSLKMSKIPSPISGVTINNIDNLSEITTALKKLPYKATARIVFDEDQPPSEYTEAVNEIHQYSYIMGEILDSAYVGQYTFLEFKKRVQEYLNASFRNKINIWEIGNEINGEWLGKTSDVVKKMKYAYDYVRQKKGTTALTLYYNIGCSDKEHEMFNWVKKNIPSNMKNNLNYVFVSYYPDQCHYQNPDWQNVFRKLHHIFPNSKLGFGEIGTSHPVANEQYKILLIDKYYGLDIKAPYYVGGYFWWYFIDDMVPDTKKLWYVLRDAIITQHNFFVS